MRGFINRTLGRVIKVITTTTSCESLLRTRYGSLSYVLGVSLSLLVK